MSIPPLFRSMLGAVRAVSRGGARAVMPSRVTRGSWVAGTVAPKVAGKTSCAKAKITADADVSDAFAVYGMFDADDVSAGVADCVAAITVRIVGDLRLDPEDTTCRSEVGGRKCAKSLSLLGSIHPNPDVAKAFATKTFAADVNVTMDAEASDSYVTGISGSTGCRCSGMLWRNAHILVHGSWEIGPYGSESQNPDPVGGSMVGDNGGLRWSTTTVSIDGAHTESTPVERNNGQITAGLETSNGGRMIGLLIGDKATPPVTSRLVGEVQCLFTAAYGFDTVVHSFRHVEMSPILNLVCGEAKPSTSRGRGG